MKWDSRCNLPIRQMIIWHLKGIRPNMYCTGKDLNQISLSTQQRTIVQCFDTTYMQEWPKWPVILRLTLTLLSETNSDLFIEFEYDENTSIWYICRVFGQIYLCNRVLYRYNRDGTKWKPIYLRHIYADIFWWNCVFAITTLYRLAHWHKLIPATCLIQIYINIYSQ